MNSLRLLRVAKDYGAFHSGVEVYGMEWQRTHFVFDICTEGSEGVSGWVESRYETN